jgi:hypothetical protein
MLNTRGGHSLITQYRYGPAFDPLELIDPQFQPFQDLNVIPILDHISIFLSLCGGNLAPDQNLDLMGLTESPRMEYLL